MPPKSHVVILGAFQRQLDLGCVMLGSTVCGTRIKVVILGLIHGRTLGLRLPHPGCEYSSSLIAYVVTACRILLLCPYLATSAHHELLLVSHF